MVIVFFLVAALLLGRCRAWCLGVAREVAVGTHRSRAALTGRIVRAMSWRVALVVLGIVAVCWVGSASFGTEIIAFATFAILCYPLTLLSLWQVARRISKQVFRDTSSEQQPAITAAVIESAIRANRYRLTVVEGVVGVWFVLVVLAPIAILNNFWLGERHKGSPSLPADDVRSATATSRASDYEAGSAPLRTQVPLPQTVQGHRLAYTLQLPPSWVVQKSSADMDTVSACRDMFVGVVAEEAQVGTPDSVARLVREALRTKLSDVYWSEPEGLSLDGKTWSQFVVKGKAEEVPFAYLYYVYSGPEGTFQIVGWTFQNLFERDCTTLRSVMQTFRFPTQPEPNQANSEDTKRLSSAPIANGLQQNAVNRLGTQASQILLPSGARISFSEPILFQDRASFQSSLLKKLASRGWPSGPVYSVNNNLYQVLQLARGYGSPESAYTKCFAAQIKSGKSSSSVTLNNRTWIMTDLDDGYIDPLTSKKVLTESAFCYLYSDDKQTVLVLGVMDLATKLGWEHPKACGDYSNEEKVKNLLESSECMNTTEHFAAGFESF